MRSPDIRSVKRFSDLQTTPDHIAITGAFLQLRGMPANRIGEAVTILERNRVSGPGFDQTVIQFIAVVSQITVFELALQEGVVSTCFDGNSSPEIVLRDTSQITGDRIFTVAGELGIERNPRSVYFSDSQAQALAGFSDVAD